MTLHEVMCVYMGSDGAKTRELYRRLERVGPQGTIAVELLRAQKSSERAKVYRGAYKGKSYDKKQWAMNNLVRVLEVHAADFGITWGWGIDEAQPFHKQVLYVDLPDCGQVSFHTAERGSGPDYPGQWDGVRNASPGRVCRYAANISAKECCS